MAGRLTSVKHETVSRMVLDILRVVSEGYLGEPYSAIVLGDVLLCMAVDIGTTQGRPMTAAKLATYIGMPRATAIRRLKALEKRGLVEFQEVQNTYTVPAHMVQRLNVLKGRRQVERFVHQTSQALSKMDTRAIDLERA